MLLQLARTVLAAAAIALLAPPSAAQEAPDARKQFFAELAVIEKIARERPLDASEWERLAALEAITSERIRIAEKKQAELDRSGKAKLYELFVRASRLEAAAKSRTITAEQQAEKARITGEIAALAEPLLEARLKQLSAKKETGEDLTIREMAVLDGLSRWRTSIDDVTASITADPALELGSPRMDFQQLLWIEQIAIMETQGQVRRDLRLKDQLADIYRWIQRRAEAQEGEARTESLRRLSSLRAKQRD